MVVEDFQHNDTDTDSSTCKKSLQKLKRDPEYPASSSCRGVVEGRSAYGFLPSNSANKYLMFVIILLLWSALYLPKLGIMEVQGTESRRMMPAAEMYHGGNFMIPELAGKEYIAKPPLIYWLQAASYAVAGESAAAARFPTTLFILVFASILVLMPSNWLNLYGRFIGAVIFLSVSGCIMAGRSADIDGGYMATTGISIFVWLNLWTSHKSKWFLWILSGIIVGIGMLFKGPLILLFFYLAVICILWYRKSLKELVSLPHLVGLILMFAIFLPWVGYVYSNIQKSDSQVSSYWLSQMLQRFNPAYVEYGKWISRAFGAIVDFAPWFLLLPLLWMKKWVNNIPEKDRLIYKALRLALLLGFLIINIPGTRSRYSLPLYPLAAVLLGWLLVFNAEGSVVYKYWKKLLLFVLMLLSFVSLILFIFVPTGLIMKIVSMFQDKLELITNVTVSLPTFLVSIVVLLVTLTTTYIIFKLRNKYNDCMHLTLISAICMILVGLNLYCMVTPFADLVFQKKQLGMVVTSALPENTKLYVYKQGYEPYYYYFKRPLEFVYDDNNLPKAENKSLYFFMDSDKFPSLVKQYEQFNDSIKIISEKKYKDDKYLVVELTNTR